MPQRQQLPDPNRWRHEASPALPGGDNDLQNKEGFLTQRESCVDGDHDLLGYVRLDGRTYRLRAWIVEREGSAPTIRMQGQRVQP